MRKTLLLVFIHGFKGGDDTFGTFPEHLRVLISHALPKVEVLAITYPRYETVGELKDCVARFREWLENKVIDLEVAHQTPSPTIDPSVHTILVGHSMGGLVAVETLLLLSSEQPLPPQSTLSNPDAPNFASNTTLNSTTGSSHPNPSTTDDALPSTNLMFPHIQGLLAFDTPFLGLNPGLIAHTLEGTHKMASNAYNTLTELGVFGWGSKTDGASVSGKSTSKQPVGALPAPTVDAAASPAWQAWGKYAMFAGAAGAIAAGGAAALYTQRETLSAGWTWAHSHLLFVWDLSRPEDLRKRVEKVNETSRERGIGSANIYTNLGKGASEGYGISDSVAGPERTFCLLPVAVRDDKSDAKGRQLKGMKWMKAINDKAADETAAHQTMFYPRENPGFYALVEQAKEAIIEWVDRPWYESSTDGRDGATLGEVGDEHDWETKLHDLDEHDVKMTDEVLEDHENKENLEGSVIVDTPKKEKDEILR